MPSGRCDQHKVVEATFADRRRGSRHARGYGSAWDKTRARIMRRDGGLCRCDECSRLGRIRLAHEVDHRVPKFEGGTDDDANLQAINRDCHKAKTAAEAQRARGVGSCSHGAASGLGDPSSHGVAGGLPRGGLNV